MSEATDEAVKTDASQTATNAAQPDVGKPPADTGHRSPDAAQRRRGPPEPRETAPGRSDAQAAVPGPGNAPHRAPSRQEQLEQLTRDVPKPRSRTRPGTSAGPLDPDEVMSEDELWRRAEAEHLERNHAELERAASLGELVAVETALDNDRVAFSEYNEAHPHGFAYVAGRDSPPSIVGYTPLVQQAILDHKIRRVSDEGVIPTGERHESREAARRR